jgi:serine/threonine protein kinase
MVLDLRLHGFTNCIISDSLQDLSQKLPSWNILPITKTKLVGTKTIEHFLKPLEDASGFQFLPSYEWGKKLDEGTYGKIYQAYRKIYQKISDETSGVIHFKSVHDSKENIVIKESFISLTPSEENLPYVTKKRTIENEIDTLMHEATVLTLAYMAVKKAHMPYAVPKVHEIFLHYKPNSTNITGVNSLCISMEYIKGDTLLKFMSKHFKRSTKESNGTLFLECLKQLALILQVLQTELRMNHRDIKINNILIRNSEITAPVLVLIDYGFACIANGEQEPHAEMTNIEAGAYFGSRYACFKHCRDLAQFLYSIHCHFPFDEYFSCELIQLIKPWMQIIYKHGVANLLNGITNAGYHSETKIQNLVYDEGIYLFLRRPEVDPLQCSPANILADIETFKNKT